MRSQLSYLITSYLLDHLANLARVFTPKLPAGGRERNRHSRAEIAVDPTQSRLADNVVPAADVVSRQLAGPAPTLRLSPSLPNVRSHPCPTPRAGCDDG